MAKLLMLGKCTLEGMRNGIGSRGLKYDKRFHVGLSGWVFRGYINKTILLPAPGFEAEVFSSVREGISRKTLRNNYGQTRIRLQILFT